MLYILFEPEVFFFKSCSVSWIVKWVRNVRHYMCRHRQTNTTKPKSKPDIHLLYTVAASYSMAVSLSFIFTGGCLFCLNITFILWKLVHISLNQVEEGREVNAQELAVCHAQWVHISYILFLRQNGIFVAEMMYY